jgi:hypothetical protein
MPILKSASIAESNCFGGPRINHVTLSFLQHNYSKRRFGEGQYEQVLTVQEDLGNVRNRAQLMRLSLSLGLVRGSMSRCGRCRRTWVTCGTVPSS